MILKDLNQTLVVPRNVVTLAKSDDHMEGDEQAEHPMGSSLVINGVNIRYSWPLDYTTAAQLKARDADYLRLEDAIASLPSGT
jgi:hypothetical protein